MQRTHVVKDLNALDRCDACGAQAKIIVTMTNGSQLLFCAHHGRENQAALLSQGAELIDPRQVLAV